MKHVLQKLLSSVLSSFGENILPENIHLEIPENKDHGDFATNTAMQLVKKLKKNPREIAQDIIDAIPENDLIEKTEIAGPGFINFYIKNRAYLLSFQEFKPEKALELDEKKKTIVEFCSPNVAKPLHIGHLRGAVIGESLARIHSFSGKEVLRENFLGDWGTGFGKLIMAIEKWGDTEKIKANPIKELVELYTRFTIEAKTNPALDDEAREAFRKIEIDKDTVMTEQWEWIRKVSIVQLKKFYDFMGIGFDIWNGESFYAQRTNELLQRIEKIGERSEGALVMKFTDPKSLDEDGKPKELMPTAVLQRKDGATLYQTRDIAHMEYLQEIGVDDYITVVGAEQTLHFRQVFATASKLGVTIGMTHVPHGLILGKDGKKFSTRGGNGVGLETLFEEAEERMKTLMESRTIDCPDDERTNLIHQVSLGAIKFNDVSQNRITDVVFDWDKMLSFEGFSGPFLQYSYARSRSIIRKSNTKVVDTLYIEKLKSVEDEMPMIKKILGFHDIIKLAAKINKPNILAEYLFELAKEFNRLYQNVSILNASTDEEKIFRLYVTDIFSKTLKQGLYLLGIEAPEQM